MLFVAFCFATAWQPAAGHTQIPIWPHVAPDAIAGAAPESARQVEPAKSVAGRTWTYVENVTDPTVTLYSPKSHNTGAALVVFPGGGYTILAMDLEGTEVCDWATSIGMTCVLLKYRVPGLAYYPKPAYPRSGPYPYSPIALEDAQRAIGLVRLHASEWHIDPHKIGVIGFSAGGHLVAAISTHFQKRLYARVDRADDESCRPDFGILLYPGHLSAANNASDAHFGHRKPLDYEIHVTRDTPPSFLVQAEDDPVDSVDNSLVYYDQLKKAGVPAELHIFAHGGHAFGLRRTKEPITAWPELADQWLRRIGVITPQAAH